MPKYQDMALFMMYRRRTDKTDHFTPCECVRGNNKLHELDTLELEYRYRAIYSDKTLENHLVFSSISNATLINRHLVPIALIHMGTTTLVII